MMQREPLGVLLTGGLGTRLRPLTPDLPKALVPLLNMPLLTYGLDLLAGHPPTVPEYPRRSLWTSAD